MMENENIQILNDGFVKHIKTLGNELDICNNARISFKKEKKVLDEADIKLINYLAKNKHMSPFRSCHVMYHIKMPIFVMRQFIRHRYGCEVNEMSGRYVEFENESYYFPEHFRYQSTNNKQGSGEDLPDLENFRALEMYMAACRNSFMTYYNLLDMNIAKEMARMVLPLSLWTEIRVTMSLEAIVHFIKLREDSHAQFEIRQYSDAIKKIAIQEFPNAIPALLNV